jgi:uncharacterized protein
MTKTEAFELKLGGGQAVRGALSFADAGEITGRPAVVFAHGLGSTRGGEKAAALEDECARRGWAFAAFDFRGHGASGGTTLEMTGSRLLEDLDAVTRFVSERAGGPVCLFGSSMGGWAGAWFAALNPGRVAACAFVAPAFRFLEWPRLDDAERERWRLTGRRRVLNEFIDLELGAGLLAEAAAFKFEELAARFAAPCLIFHGMRDDVVPHAVSVEFAERCASAEVELTPFKSGDHRLNLFKERMARSACDFFAARAAGSLHSP